MPTGQACAVRPTTCARSEAPADLTPLVAPGGGLALVGPALALAAAGVSTTHLGDGAVTTVKLAADARAAAGSVVLSGSTALTAPTVIDSITVDVPGPGTLLVTVSGMLLIDADATTAAALTVPARIGLCDTASSDAQCAGTYSQVWYQDADDANGFNATPAFTLVRTAAVAAAGARVFYLNGEAAVGTGGLTLWQDPIVGLGPVATAMFFPGSLPVTSP